MFFKNENSIITVTEIGLKKDYKFMYENSIISNQETLLLLLGKNEDNIEALKFDFLIYKCGYPNDEVCHPLSKYGLGVYGLFMVCNSPWILELKENNRQHPRHTDSMFENYKHYVAKFKDLTIEVICTEFEETQFTHPEILTFFNEQIGYLEK